MTATLIRSSFLLESLGKLAKDSLESSESLSGEILTIFNKEIVIYFIFLERPAAFTDLTLDRKLQFLHSMILRLKNVFFATLVL
jgi:hypothetical protein